MYIEAILLGLVIGLVRRGNINNLLSTPFKGKYIVALAVLIFMLPYVLIPSGFEMNHAVFPFFAVCLVAVVALLNHRIQGMKTIMFGTVANIVALVFHGFQMPVAMKVLEYAGNQSLIESIAKGEVLNYMIVTNPSLVSYLGKIIPLPTWYPLGTVLSIGDCFVCIGIVLVIQSCMVHYTKGDMYQFSFTPRAR